MDDRRRRGYPHARINEKWMDRMTHYPRACHSYRLCQVDNPGPSSLPPRALWRNSHRCTFASWRRSCAFHGVILSGSSQKKSTQSVVLGLVTLRIIFTLLFLFNDTNCSIKCIYTCKNIYTLMFNKTSYWTHFFICVKILYPLHEFVCNLVSGLCNMS